MVLVWLRLASLAFCAVSYLNLPKSMIFATGGLELGATSTKSRSAAWARRRASSMRTTPTCSPCGPTRRTSGTRIRSFVLGSLMRFSSYLSGVGRAVDECRQATRGKNLRWQNCRHSTLDYLGALSYASAGCQLPGNLVVAKKQQAVKRGWENLHFRSETTVVSEPGRV